jgi:hypothetical protein
LLDLILVLQSGNNALDLVEWFLASVGLVVAVTLVYVFILSKSTAPPTMTVAKVEEAAGPGENLAGVQVAIQKTGQALQAHDFRGVVEESAEAVSIVLRRAAQVILGRDLEGAGIADLAYIIQSKSKTPINIAEPTYQLNNLRLRAIQDQPIQEQEATWAASFSKWLVELLGQQ